MASDGGADADEARTERRRGRPRNDPMLTRRRLIDSAIDEFGAHGYYGTDTNKIARGAGVAPATFYRYFDDKLAIFLSVYADWVEREWRVIDSALERPAGRTDPVSDLIDDVLDHHARWVTIRGSMHALVAVDARAKAFGDDLRRRQIDRFIASVEPEVRCTTSRAELAFAFLAIERANNALTDGDLDALDIDRDQFIEHLATTIRRLQPLTPG